jgi:hypothetical protein
MEVEMESGGRDIFVIVDGVRVAKRGSPGTRASRDVGFS